MGGAEPSLISLMIVTTALGVAALGVITMTGFAKISIVLFLLRNALGVQQAPPNIVLYGIALILTGFISLPVVRNVSQAVNATPSEYRTVQDWVGVAERGVGPLKANLQRFTTIEERTFFLNAAKKLWPEDQQDLATADDLVILVPSFMTAELRRGFEIGFLLYLPFVTIDLVITTILMAMGMSQVQPTTITVPLKLFLFVTVEGWTRLLHGLVVSYV